MIEPKKKNFEEEAEKYRGQKVQYIFYPMEK